MPTILENIIEYEPDVLMMIAEAWGVDLHIDQRKNIAEQLAHLISDAENAREMLAALAKPEKQAIHRLAAHQGRIPWDRFERQYGELREMGAARREKERPDRNPLTVSENLFYKGLLGRAFFESSRGIREHAFLPDEFLAIISEGASSDQVAPPAAKVEKAIILAQNARDRLLDHACTLLSLLRSGGSVGNDMFQNPPADARFLGLILEEIGLLEEDRVSHPDQVKAFLEAPRHVSFSRMLQTWVHSQTLNEMDFLSELACKGGWKNQPARNRSDLLDWIAMLPTGSWYTLDDFVAWVRSAHPDFMRAGGEYEAWIIQHLPGGEYLRGLEHWERVEGAYLRFMLTGPLTWLGLLQVGSSAKNDPAVYIRKSDIAEMFLHDGQVEYARPSVSVIKPGKGGLISVDPDFPLHIRYLLGRFCLFQGEKRGRYHYQIAPVALRRAEKNGLKIAQFASLLRKYTREQLPKNLLAALERWAESHQQVDMNPAWLLKVPAPPILEEIMASAHKEHIVEVLNPTTAVINPKSIPALRSLLLEIGVLAEIHPAE